jgi:RNA polymerase sigma-70 factor (ECF subfamily)
MLQPLTTRDDLEHLLRSVRGGNPSALAELYERYGPLAHRTAFRLTGSSDDADDVVQDVFIGLPEALGRYDERGRFDQWIGRVVVRVTLMRMRSVRRRADTIAARSPQFHPEPHGEANALHDRVAIDRALEQLAPNARVVFVLKAVEGYTHAEIADMLGVSRAAAEVRYWRAIRRLRSLLGSER